VVRTANSTSDYYNILSRYSLVLVAFLDNSEESRRFEQVLERLDRELRWINSPAELVKVYCDKCKDLFLREKVDSTPYVKVYLEGKVIFEQRGSLGDIHKDVYILRRGVRDTLRRYGRRIRF